jgi:hypothetical protein
MGSLLGGVIYGAVVGVMDGGFGSFDTQLDAVTKYTRTTRAVLRAAVKDRARASMLGKIMMELFRVLLHCGMRSNKFSIHIFDVVEKTLGYLPSGCGL